MNTLTLHPNEKAVSTAVLFKGEEGTTISLRILAGEMLKAHTTKVQALLICLSGAVVYEDEKERKIPLRNGDYVDIEALVTHWVLADVDSQLLLLK
jgi:quercetin dioxygenase-like cupin family protein